MVRISTGPFTSALIVESPHKSLDEHLRLIGIKPTRLESVPDEDALIEEMQKCKAQLLFKRSRVLVTRKMIESCPDLHAIQLCCIGDDSIDKEACADHGILVYNDPVSNGRSVLELAITHLIALSRRLYESNHNAHQNHWDKNAHERYEIKGKRLGIVGLGNIGRQIARICEQLGMDIYFHDNRPVAEEIGIEMGWEFCSSLEDLFAKSDMVTVHTSAKDHRGVDNLNFLDPYLPMLGKERPEASPRIFLNLARGNIYSTEALIDAVKQGSVRRAAVDVFPEEPAPGAADKWVNPYAEYPQIICSPHIGAATMEAQPRIARHVSTTITRLSRFGSLRNCVFSPRSELSVADGSQGHAILAVTHSTARGTKKAIDDAIYQAEVSNLGSVHRDFGIGVAYDLSVLERPLSQSELEQLVKRTAELTQSQNAIRAIRQIEVPKNGW